MKTKTDLSGLKGTNFYIFIEICLFVSNVMKLFLDNKPSYWLLVILFVVIIVHLFIVLKKKREGEIPNDLAFMVDFADSIGYTDTEKIKSFKDGNCSIDCITKTYTINKNSVIVVKEYEGRIKSSLSDSIRMMTCGGSSRDLEDIELSISQFDYSTNQYVPSKYDLISEQERMKLLRVRFKSILSKNDKFKVRYEEKNWEGAMRENRDGIVIGEHLFFNPLIEQVVTIVFPSGANYMCSVYKYNFKLKKIEKVEVQLNYSNNSCKVSLRSLNDDSLYFFMYDCT